MGTHTQTTHMGKKNKNHVHAFMQKQSRNKWNSRERSRPATQQNTRDTNAYNKKMTQKTSTYFLTTQPWHKHAHAKKTKKKLYETHPHTRRAPQGDVKSVVCADRAPNWPAFLQAYYPRRWCHAFRASGAVNYKDARASHRRASSAQSKSVNPAAFHFPPCQEPLQDVSDIPPSRCWTWNESSRTRTHTTRPSLWTAVYYSPTNTTRSRSVWSPSWHRCLWGNVQKETKAGNTLVRFF